MFTVAAATGNFFDRKAVTSAVDRAKRRVLSRAGAFVRTRAISLILRHVVRKGFGAKSRITNRRGVSLPGEPPYSHVGLLAKFLFFAWDGAAESVVIGPAKINRPGNAPELLEHGGSGSFTTYRIGRRGGPRGVVSVVKRGTWRPRPFMAPALDAERDKLPPLWAGSVR